MILNAENAEKKILKCHPGGIYAVVVLARSNNCKDPALVRVQDYFLSELCVNKNYIFEDKYWEEK